MTKQTMNWSQLMNSGRLGDKRKNYEQSAVRSAFQRDFDRVVFSSAFRRLQDKTQVFPVPASDFVHSRLTHSIEVSSVGRTLGSLAGEFVLEQEPGLEAQGLSTAMFGDVVAAASLAHDVGNPPFGHSGEDAIAAFFTENESTYRKGLSDKQWADFIRYEGNAHGFRLLTNHHPGEIQGGLRLTYATLATFTKYPRESLVPAEDLIKETIQRTSSKKFNFFQSERGYFKEVALRCGLLPLTQPGSSSLVWCRHPLSFLVEAADNICYRLIDLEDGYKLGFLHFDEVEKLLYPFVEMSRDRAVALKQYAAMTDEGEKIGYLRARAISQLINQSMEVFKANYLDIMQGRFDSELTDMIASASLLEGDIKKANIFLYNQKPVVEIEITGYKIISGLLAMYLKAVRQPNTKLHRKIVQLMPGQFRPHPDDGPYQRILKTTDYIARMSDGYALNLYRRLTGQSLPEIA